jgi:hypothetical protein
MVSGFVDEIETRAGRWLLQRPGCERREALGCCVTSPRRPGAIAGDAMRISRDRLTCTASD